MGYEAHHPFRSEAVRAEYLAWYDGRARGWPVPFEERVVGTSFGETFVRVSGPGDGAPLVLLPGDTETSLSWARLVDQFASRRRVYAPDQIFDHGRSVFSRPLERPADFVRWFGELLDGLGLDAVELIGFSYGGWIASLFSLNSPQRVRRLALLAPPGTVLGPSIGLMARAMLYYFVPWRPITRRYLRWYNPAAARGPTEVRARLEESIEELVLSRRAFARRKFIGPTVLTDEEWASLTMPTLFVVGELEVTYSAERALRRLHSVAPQVRTRLLPGVGHDLLLVEPELVAREVVAFLDEG